MRDWWASRDFRLQGHEGGFDGDDREAGSRRSRARWRDFLAATVEEAAVRSEGTKPDLAAYTTLRRRTMAIHLFYDFAEAGARFEAPRRAMEDRQITHMIDVSSDLVSHVNDVMSLEKEEAAGEVHNLVMVLQRERHCTRPQAINTIHVQINDLLRSSTEAQACLADLARALGLGEQEEADLLRYADLMATMIRGNHDWSRLTHRYGTQTPRAPALRTTDM
ncbi:terpene synthase family protein [Streptomyces sp. NPDC001307]|uniref:terpene synthase family protein n=1 Tax=Streptomyces sp. NPDC001307 TaxID=3364560 RepID=UPI00369867AA